MFKLIWETLAQRPFRLLLAIILFSISLTIVNFAIFTKNAFASKQETLISDATYFVDIDFSEGFGELYENPNGEELLKQMYIKLKNNDTFRYYEFYKQFLYILNYSGPSVFKYGYEEGMEAEDVEFGNNGNNILASPIKSVQVSNNCFARFNLELHSGRHFNSNDFDYDDKKQIPVIMGYEYKDHFNIGQELECIYIAKKFQLVIIGFLEKDSYIKAGNSNPLYLDMYIVMPSINCNYKPLNYEEKLFQIRHYANKTGGFLEVGKDLSVSYVKLILDNISSECSLRKYDILGQNVIIFDLFAVSTKQMWNAIVILGSFLLLISSIILIIILIRTVSRNIPAYCGYLLSGAKLITIKICILSEIALIIVLSNIISFLLLFAVNGNVYTYNIFAVLISALNLIITSFITIKILNKSSLSSYMGRQQ